MNAAIRSLEFDVGKDRKDIADAIEEIKNGERITTAARERLKRAERSRDERRAALKKLGVKS